MDLLKLVEKYHNEGLISDKIAATMRYLIPKYLKAVKSFDNKDVNPEKTLGKFLTMAIDQIQQPYQFPPFHQAIRKPFDYVQFNKDFIGPLVVFEKSKINGLENVTDIDRFIDSGGNVILFANHQTEPDAIMISMLLEKEFQKLANEMIFVAGDRVTTDPLAISASMGCNLLCIYSKRHIETPPEKKEEKLAHNKSVMIRMKELLDEGGKCIYVAPSGGRDRPDAKGIVELAPFDAQSIEMFRIIAEKATKPTRFHPLALWTFPVMPPPNTVEKELIEKRRTRRSPVQLAFGKPLDLKKYPHHDNPDKMKRRSAMAMHVWTEVNKLYQQLDKGE